MRQSDAPGCGWQTCVQREAALSPPRRGSARRSDIDRTLRAEVNHASSIGPRLGGKSAAREGRAPCTGREDGRNGEPAATSNAHAKVWRARSKRPLGRGEEVVEHWSRRELTTLVSLLRGEVAPALFVLEERVHMKARGVVLRRDGGFPELSSRMRLRPAVCQPRRCERRLGRVHRLHLVFAPLEVATEAGHGQPRELTDSVEPPAEHGYPSSGLEDDEDHLKAC